LSGDCRTIFYIRLFNGPPIFTFYAVELESDVVYFLLTFSKLLSAEELGLPAYKPFLKCGAFNPQKHRHSESVAYFVTTISVAFKVGCLQSACSEPFS
jgi:hypothetical protein